MTVKRIMLVLTLACMIAIPAAILRAQSSESTTEQPTTEVASQGGLLDVLDRLKEAQARRLEGTWHVEATLRDCQTGAAIGTFPGLHTYVRGGSMLSNPAVSPLLSTGHGVWKHAGGQSFTNTIVLFRFNPDGTYAGTSTVTRNIELGDNGDEFTSTDTSEGADPNGNVIGIRCATAIGRRLE